jgi:hypothetical protein
MKNMSVSYAPNKLRVPPGFQALLEGLAREVLREQPHDCVDFCAKYFRSLVEQRESKYFVYVAEIYRNISCVHAHSLHKVST